MSLADVRIVLVEPSHPGNVGAVARAMKALRDFNASLARGPTTRANYTNDESNKPCCNPAHLFCVCDEPKV